MTSEAHALEYLLVSWAVNLHQGKNLFWLESYQKYCRGRLSPSTGTVVEKAGKEMKTKQGYEKVTKK